jgi:rubrerythrin
MGDEQAKTIEALQMAIQMEIEGQEYYQRASQESNNQAGKELFRELAIEEDKHQQRFEEIYESIRSKKAWPDIETRSEGRERQGTLFAQAMETVTPDVKATPGEIDTVTQAMDMENKTYDFYNKQAGSSTYDVGGGFYKALAAEERNHYLALVDYREYLLDPAGWFANKEHPSLDGG